MLLRSHLLVRQPNLSQDGFHGRLVRESAVLAARVPGILHYTVNVVFDRSHRLTIDRGPFQLDAITHMVFEGVEERDRGVHSREYAALSHLLRPWLKTSLALDIRQRTFLPPPSSGALHAPWCKERIGLLKRMSVLQRSPELSAAQFQHAWEKEHGPLVAARAGALRGYLQDAVEGCTMEYGDEALPACDGLTELWFEDVEAMDSVLPRSAPSTVTGNAARIISNISTLLVREIAFF